MSIDIPDKLAFKKRDVVNITKLDGKVIDYWEREFEVFKPVVSKKGERFYSRKDLEIILRIKELLVVEKINKSRIKEILKEELPGIELSERTNEQNVKKDLSELENIKNGLKEILTLLDKDDKK